MDKFGFPGVLGVVDGTHIAVLKPRQEHHNFLNRKGFHSLNVQIICDSNLKILSLNANYPGSTHDSFIWRNSGIRATLFNQHALNLLRGTWLIGDSGYPLEPFLMTPYGNALPGTPQAQFNNQLAIARNCIERCIGLLKMRFRCLLKERVARYDPLFVGRIVNVCAALHNMCIDYNVDLIDDNMEEDENYVFPHIVANPGPLHNEAQLIRNRIVDRYFHNL